MEITFVVGTISSKRPKTSGNGSSLRRSEWLVCFHMGHKLDGSRSDDQMTRLVSRNKENDLIFTHVSQQEVCWFDSTAGVSSDF